MIRFIHNLEKVLLIIGLALCIIFLSLSILLRYLGSPSNWAEESIRYIMVWITFIGASRCYLDKSHYRIELFKNIKNNKLKLKIDLLVLLLVAIFSIFLVYYGLEIVLFSYKSQQITASMRLPIWIVYLCVPISGITSLLNVCICFKQTKGKEII